MDVLVGMAVLVHVVVIRRPMPMPVLVLMRVHVTMLMRVLVQVVAANGLCAVMLVRHTGPPAQLVL